MNEDKSTMGMKIAEQRKKNQLTQAELAEKMHVTDKAVSKWERDICCPDVTSLSRLAEILGMSVEELLNASIPSRPQQKMEKIGTTVLRAVALAMGVSVVVLSCLGGLDVPSAISLLGIGLVCLAIESFSLRQ